MAEQITLPTDQSVDAFLETVSHSGRREDAINLCALISERTGMEPRMWGDSIVGFGQYEYTYESGHRGTHFLTGFSPRKSNLVVYITPGFSAYQDELLRLGKHRHSVSCLYLGRLKSVDLDVLMTIITDSVSVMKQRYPAWIG